jgi:hypothetical protein
MIAGRALEPDPLLVGHARQRAEDAQNRIPDRVHAYTAAATNARMAATHEAKS